MLRIKKRSETVTNPAGGKLELFPNQRQLHWRETENEKWFRIGWIIVSQKRITFIRFFNEEQRKVIRDWVAGELGWEADKVMTPSVPNPEDMPQELREDVLVDTGDDS